MAIPLVDVHQHLWDLDHFELPWLSSVPALNDHYRMSRYLEEANGVEVAKTVYMEVDVAPGQIGMEADFVLGLIDADDNPMAGATLRARPGEADFGDHVSRFASDDRVKGYRQVLQIPELGPGHCLSDAFIRDVRKLGEQGKHFDICMRPAELGDGVKLVEACTDTRFVVDHCGNAHVEIVNGSVSPDEVDPGGMPHDADQWRRDMEALGARENTICKISGIIARLPEGNNAAETLAPTVNHCLETFGADRVVFGSDWPVCTLGAAYPTWVNALANIIADRSEDDQRKFWSGNAERFYTL
tara:strand:- start:28229 stop:29128 length:900 start_codon:yes stop_codon:yes gene_type:complete